jgi:hypothetical protein
MIHLVLKHPSQAISRMLTYEPPSYIRPPWTTMPRARSASFRQRWQMALDTSPLDFAMSRFPSAKHLTSWAGVSPGNHQSGGKRYPAGTTGSNRWIRWSKPNGIECQDAVESEQL